MTPPDPRDPTTPKLRRLARAIEERMTDLVDSGALAGLPGEGKPLPPDRSPQDERWAASHIAIQERALPTWMELGREIDTERERLGAEIDRHRAWLAARRATLERLPAE